MTRGRFAQPQLGRYGVWLLTDSISPNSPSRSNRWATGRLIGGSPDADLAVGGTALAETSSLQLATGYHQHLVVAGRRRR